MGSHGFSSRERVQPEYPHFPYPTLAAYSCSNFRFRLLPTLPPGHLSGYDWFMNDWHLARSYRYAGIVSGLRNEPERRDLAVIISDRPAAAAGVFTQNRVCAAPVQVSRARLPRADARAIVICSGNANACTGEQGLADARRVAELVAAELRCPPEQVLVAS